MLQPAYCFLPLVQGVPAVLGVLSPLPEILAVVLRLWEVVLVVWLHMLPLAEGNSSWVSVLAAAHTVQKLVPMVLRIEEGPVPEVVHCLPVGAWLASPPVLVVAR